MQKSYTFDDIQIKPLFSEIESRKECNISTKLINVKLKIPIISSPMDTVTEWQMINELNRFGAAGALHRFMQVEEMENNLREIEDDPLIISIGTKPEVYNNCLRVAVEDYGVKIILIDVAHGDSSYVKRTLQDIKEKYSIKVIAGNIATYDAACHLIEWGADGLRVGIGNGSLCESRIRTGIGVPQVTAIAEVNSAINAMGRDITLIADGGIKTPGDFSKAIALGADVVMIGSLFAGTKESPGRLIREGQFPDEQLYKLYRGSASQSAKIARGEDDHHIEGNSKKIRYKGKVKRIVRELEDGLRSSMSYVGAKNLDEFRKNAEFYEVTYAGQIEAQPHLLLK